MDDTHRQYIVLELARLIDTLDRTIKALQQPKPDYEAARKELAMVVYSHGHVRALYDEIAIHDSITPAASDRPIASPRRRRGRPGRSARS